MSTADYPIGTELRSAHGTRWVKVEIDTWLTRGEFGNLDHWNTYSDQDVSGNPVPTEGDNRG